MNEFLTLLATKTAILTAFALLVGAATALVRRLDAKTTQLCWAFVLANGIVGGIAPFGPTLPEISWKPSPETPPTFAPTETVIETKNRNADRKRAANVRGSRTALGAGIATGAGASRVFAIR